MSSISGSVDFTAAQPANLTSRPVHSTHDPEAGLVLAIDGRIDATHELRNACIAAGHPPRCFGPAELVLRAYRAWGETCPARILGEYAFAIWDYTRQRLFCARDSGGVRPLFYAVLPSGAFHFATNALEVLADETAPRTLDQAGLIDFLISRGAMLPDKTPCRGIQRLPAAHTLTFDQSGLRVSRYWTVHEAPAGKFSNQTEAVEACSVALQAAIRDRAAGPVRAGISLSAGWDSGAVFAVWQAMRGSDSSLPEPWFYTYYGDSPESDERPEVRELLRRWPAHGEFVHLDAGRGLHGLDEHCARLGMPEPASGWRWVGECAAAARKAGITQILTGEAGNEVFQSSIMRPVDLLRAGCIRDAYRQAQAWGRDAETSTRSFLWPFVIRPALAACFPAVRNAVRSRRSGPLVCLTDSSRSLALDLISQTNARNQSYLPGRAISSWEKRVALDRWCSDLFPLPAGPELQEVTLTAPYLDRRVVSSALAALDSESSVGSTRQLLASVVQVASGRAFRGRYAHYTGLLDKMLRSELENNTGLFAASNLVELGVIDPNRLKVLVDGFRTGSGAPLGLLWRLLSAEVWARRFLT